MGLQIGNIYIYVHIIAYVKQLGQNLIQHRHSQILNSANEL